MKQQIEEKRHEKSIISASSLAFIKILKYLFKDIEYLMDDSLSSQASHLSFESVLSFCRLFPYFHVVHTSLKKYHLEQFSLCPS